MFTDVDVQQYVAAAPSLRFVSCSQAWLICIRSQGNTEKLS
jgi:hypothetical protein